MDKQWTGVCGIPCRRKEVELRQDFFTVTDNRPLSPGLYRMDLTGDTRGIRADGSFVNVAIPGKYLRRPISVYRALPGQVTLVYKVVGEGTARMAEWTSGTKAELLTGLGSGYDASRAGEKPLLVGGGYGAASLYGLARSLALAGRAPSVVLGFNASEEAGFLGDFIDLIGLGASVRVATRDGSLGAQGLATDLIEPDHPAGYTFLFACGPLPMLRALAERTEGLPGQFSLEARMGCGFGACMGCSVMTKNGAKRICVEGPVLDKEEVLWTQA